MSKPIVQTVTFKASPDELFEIYTDSKMHSAATGAKASVSAKAGTKFTADHELSLATGMKMGRPELCSCCGAAILRSNKIGAF